MFYFIFMAGEKLCRKEREERGEGRERPYRNWGLGDMSSPFIFGYKGSPNQKGDEEMAAL